MIARYLHSSAANGFDMTIETLIPRHEAGTAARDENERIREFSETEFNWLKRIESILRNGLPNSDKGVAETIAHAHSELELLLESIDPDWWMK